MSNRDDEIRDRIMGDEDFGAPPEHEAQAALVRRFRNARKKLLVHLTLWVLVSLGVCAAGAFVLGHVSETRMMLAALFVMLVGFESTVLIKLWYWTLDSKAALMEQLQRLGLRLEGGVEPAANGLDEKVKLYDRISMKWYGRAASALVLVAGLSFGVWVLAPLFHSNASVVYRSECHAVLDAAGAARMTGRMTFTYYGVTPLATVRVPTGDRLQDAQWTDVAGRELPSTQEQYKGGWVSLVRLAQPVFREESADLRVTWTVPQAAKEQGGEWTFTGDAAWRKGLWPQLPLTINAGQGGKGDWSQATSTVTLPPGCSDTSAEPQGWMAWSDYAGLRTVSFRDLQRTEETVEVRYKPHGS
jgi:hypothetical protein